MKLVAMRRDGHTAYVKPKDVVTFLTIGWELPTVKVMKCSKK